MHRDPVFYFVTLFFIWMQFDYKGSICNFNVELRYIETIS
jgi:hypothetical protein